MTTKISPHSINWLISKTLTEDFVEMDTPKSPPIMGFISEADSRKIALDIMQKLSDFGVLPIGNLDNFELDY